MSVSMLSQYLERAGQRQTIHHNHTSWQTEVPGSRQQTNYILAWDHSEGSIALSYAYS